MLLRPNLIHQPELDSIDPDVSEHSDPDGGGEATEWFARHRVPDRHACSTDPTMAYDSCDAIYTSEANYYGKKFLRMAGMPAILKNFLP